MDILQRLRVQAPAAPALTVYVESEDPRLCSRMEFSALTLDNWVSKIGNGLRDEFLLDESVGVAVADSPIRWQLIVTVLGALRAGVPCTVAQAVGDVVDRDDVDLFVGMCDGVYGADVTLPVAVVADDAWGRSVGDIPGVDLPVTAGEVHDFVGAVRVQADVYCGPETDATGEQVAALMGRVPVQQEGPTRFLFDTSWQGVSQVWLPVAAELARGNSVVIVTGQADAGRIEKLAATEQVTASYRHL